MTNKSSSLLQKYGRRIIPYFALCDMCFWSASVLAGEQGSRIEYCPVCHEQNRLSLIPLNFDETYSYVFNSRGIEMAFGTR